MTSFYLENIEGDEVRLDEEGSKHAINVLRMKVGDKILLTNGKGFTAEGEIADAHRKRAIIAISSTRSIEPSASKVCIAISLIKNTSRFEWFLEKATEIGVNEIIPLVCDRTEKEQFRYDRMKSIVVSAMLQSQQSWLPILHQPTPFTELLDRTDGRKLIAHCIPSAKKQNLNFSEEPSLLAIGPEGDFSEEEIDLALKNNFIPVSLGETRLRTETAGIVGAVLMKF